MRTATGARRGLLVLLAVLATVGLVGTAVYAAVAKADFTLGSNPTSQSVQQGGTASYALTVAGSGGFTGSVALTAAVTPTGPTASLTPTSVTLSSTTTSGSSKLTVATAKTTPAGKYSITVSGTGGGTKHSLTLTLNVSYTSLAAFTLTATPTSVTVAAGSSAGYALAITRSSGFTGAITLAGYGNYPTGTGVTFTPNPVTGTSATMQVNTNASTTPTGTYTLYVVGSAIVNGSTQYQYAKTQLLVSAPSGQPFTIGGNLSGTLAPGVPPKLLNLSLTNPNSKSLSITGLTVTISAVTKAANVNATCTTGDYAVSQYSGPYPLTLAGGQTATLTQLGVPTASQPQLQMLDTKVSQDGCKGATLTLAYAGSGQGN